MPLRRVVATMLVAAVVAASCTADDEASPATPPDTPDAAPATPADRPVDTADQAALESESESEDAATSTTTPPPTTEPPVLDVGRDPDAEPGEPEVPTLPEGYEGFRSATYGLDEHWLCRPGNANDVCARDLDATIVNADGTTEVQPFERADDADVDCFYVYPTVSTDPEANSDRAPHENEEIAAVLVQAARLGAVCDVYAPIYRQRTLTALFGQVESGADTRDVAYEDVRDAFLHYLANDSDGRPFVLVGHSQGAGILRRLLTEEIDRVAVLRDRLVSALLIGTSVGVDEFDFLAPCGALDDTGCIVSYASYRDTAPPAENALFGRTLFGPALCVNPADPAGGEQTLAPYFRVLAGGPAPFDDLARTTEITTPFATYPEMYTAACVDDGEFGYLRITNRTPPGPRTDDLGGDLTPEWGLHLVDVQLAMGNLVDLVAAQVAAFG